MDNKSLTENLNTYLESQGIQDTNQNVELSSAEILSALAATKDIQQYLMPYQGKKGGIFGMLTSTISKIVVAMMSEPLAKQQKFNNLVYKYLQQLADKK